MTFDSNQIEEIAETLADEFNLQCSNYFHVIGKPLIPWVTNHEFSWCRSEQSYNYAIISPKCKTIQFKYCNQEDNALFNSCLLMVDFDKQVFRFHENFELKFQGHPLEYSKKQSVYTTFYYIETGEWKEIPLKYFKDTKQAIMYGRWKLKSLCEQVKKIYNEYPKLITDKLNETNKKMKLKNIQKKLNVLDREFS